MENNIGSKYVPSNSDKPRRILKILEFLTMNNQASTEEICKMLYPEYADKSLRTIQRDLSFLRDEGWIEMKRESKETQWFIKIILKFQLASSKIAKNELLSLYMLKSYLKTFQGTKIEKDINKLYTILSTSAPGEIFIDKAFHWDQNFGIYDYSTKDYIINSVLGHIQNQHIVNMKYKKFEKETLSEYLLLPKSLFTYNGTLYLVAYDCKKKEYRNYILHQIVEIVKSESHTDVDVDKIKFDIEDFKKQRFAVFSGDVKKVKLSIKKEYKHFFINRHWHTSQQGHINSHTGDYILNLEVPESPEFISWILGWSDIITVLEPLSLRNKVINLAGKIITNYEKQNI